MKCVSIHGVNGTTLAMKCVSIHGVNGTVACFVGGVCLLKEMNVQIYLSGELPP